jgi:hypothetical protein
MFFFLKNSNNYNLIKITNRINKLREITGKKKEMERLMETLDPYIYEQGSEKSLDHEQES